MIGSDVMSVVMLLCCGGDSGSSPHLSPASIDANLSMLKPKHLKPIFDFLQLPLNAQQLKAVCDVMSGVEEEDSSSSASASAAASASASTSASANSKRSGAGTSSAAGSRGVDLLSFFRSMVGCLVLRRGLGGEGEGSLRSDGMGWDGM